MYYDQITIDPIVFDWTAFIVFAAIFAVLAIVTLILWISRKEAQKKNANNVRKLTIAVNTMAVMLMVTIAGGFIYGVIMKDKDTYTVVDRQLDALMEQLGYNPVSIIRGDNDEPNTFTARTSEGTYTSGELVLIEEGSVQTSGDLIDVEKTVYILKLDEY